MEGHALLLGLAAEALAQQRESPPDEIFQHLSVNPQSLLSLALDRAGRSSPALATLWQRVTKPVLAVLLTACEPVERTHLQEIVSLQAPARGGCPHR
uniref:Uncharacterized protein n=1 Tax=Thermogemmatispora argillosa TaxID=2045280 RepID=A0A455SY57_9CHLR|nr:hypothetical protein KTA_03000 [Thermogemmatispora argillosa]